MQFRNRSLVILICLFLISFKLAAGSVFIHAAIERVHMHQTSFASFVSDQSYANKETTDGQQQAHSLFLMSHVAANVSDTSIIVLFRPADSFVFNCFRDTLFTQNFPDSVFKPPKAAA